jgi:hypothetical protein
MSASICADKENVRAKIKVNMEIVGFNSGVFFKVGLTSYIFSQFVNKMFQINFSALTLLMWWVSIHFIERQWYVRYNKFFFCNKQKAYSYQRVGN